MAANYQIYRPEWRGWNPGERESFFAAIERHQRAAWRVTLVSVFANVAMAVALSVLIAPLFYSVAILALDLVNLATPMPNLVDGVYQVIDPILDSPTSPTIVDWLRFVFWASLPGLLWFGCVLLGVRRMLRVSGLFDVDDVPARMPNPHVLAEQRLTNVIMEMSMAASLPLPRILIAPHASLNAAVFGSNPAHATIVISQGLLTRLNRDEMQGVAAHLLACIANGDMRIGLRAAQTLALFAIFGRISSIVLDGRGASRRLCRILRSLSFPTIANARALYSELGDPLAPNEEPQQRPKREGGILGKLRAVLLAALWGPVAIAGFFGGYVGTFLLGPLLALVWRRRKYMADATAVRLTRDPDTLGQALQKIAASGSRATLAPTVAHLSIVQPDSGTGILGGVVPMFPSLARRLRTMATLGAHLDREPERLPQRTVVILAAAIGVAAPLVLLVIALLAYLSLAVSLFATGMTVGLAHVALRWLGSLLS